MKVQQCLRCPQTDDGGQPLSSRPCMVWENHYLFSTFCDHPSLSTPGIFFLPAEDELLSLTPGSMGSYFPNQGLSLRLLHWKADSQVLNHWPTRDVSLFSFGPSSPLPITSFPAKNLHSSPLFWDPSWHCAVITRYYCQCSFPASHPEQGPYSCSNTACRKTTQRASAFEGRLWVSEGQRICISNEHPGDAHVKDSPVRAFTFDCSFIPHHFFHLPEMVPKNHHWSSHRHIQWLVPLFLASLLRPQYRFPQVVTCHPSLETSSLGFTDMRLLWFLFHGQLQFPSVVALPPPVTWRNLVTPQVTTLQFSICSLVYLCLCSFPRELSDFMTAKCIFQMHVSKGTFAPNHIPTSSSTWTSCS